MRKDPFTHVIPNALPKDFCDFTIQSFEEADGLMAGRCGAGVNPQLKSSTDFMITQNLHNNNWSYIYNYLMENLLYYLVEYMREIPFIYSDSKCTSEAALIRTVQSMLFSSSNFIPHIQMQRYISNDGFYVWHNEWSPELDSGMNFRQLFFIYYLNDVPHAGATDFKYTEESVYPETGKLIISPAFWTHKHRGNPPGDGNKKYIITSWIEIDKKMEIMEEFPIDFFK